MVLLRILKRKDASSVAVAVVVALVVYNFISVVTEKWATQLSSSNPELVSDWKSAYLRPFIWMVLELLVLEVLGWVYVWTAGAFKGKK